MRHVQVPLAGVTLSGVVVIVWIGVDLNGTLRGGIGDHHLKGGIWGQMLYGLNIMKLVF